MSVESKQKKTEIIEGLQEVFSRCTIGILTDYRGLLTSEITVLRRKLQESGSEYRVVKNTLARLAAERTGKGELAKSLEGPTGIALGYGGIAAARVLTDYIRESKVNLTIKGGFWGERFLTSEEVVALSKLPSREILLGQMLGQMKRPVSALLGCLTAPLRGITGVLQSRIRQLEGV